MDAISRRYRKPKGRPSKRSLCASKVQKRWGKNHMQSDFDSTVCAKNSDILLAENSIIMHTENSISDEGSDAGENEQYLNASARKFQMFPSTSTSTFCPSEKSTYVLMNNDMWSSLLCNIKCDECDMCSLDVECNGAYGFSSKIELKCKSCKKIFNSVFSSPRDDDSKCFEANKKLVEAFLKIGKGHAALELFSMAIGIHAMDKKTFSKCLLKLYEEKCSFKEDILEISRKVVRKHHEDLLGIANGVIDITVSYDGTWQKRGHSSFLAIEHNELSVVSVDISHKRDKRRLAQSEKKNSSDWKKKRISNKLAKSSKFTRNIKKEGETYGSGKF
ncbi:uncharacterized protein TNIN_349921 [Trichonephila inaurata madagascariensis]|uniref:Mutator-like transposase domain-containing protein n=1 Tax=Trichonephila inaurata madagascariensis TaxID=2747483 RepID=A0A8X6IMN4_9ARAC|nr:uncharacterized protein TNIN_349921 [Trichonephila inaurata madagascariensis]